MGAGPSTQQSDRKGEPKIGSLWLDHKTESKFNPLAYDIDFKAAPTPQSQLVKYESGKHWVIEPSGKREINLAEAGVASLPPRTVLSLFQTAVKNAHDHVALKVEREGKIITWSWSQYYRDVMIVARAFISLGLKQHGCVNIIGFNSPEWLIADFAAIAAGAKAAGIYTTNQSDACMYIAEHSEASIVVCQNAEQLEKYLKIRDKLPGVTTYVIWEGKVPEGVNTEDAKSRVIDWEELLKLGQDEAKLTAELEKRIAEQDPGQCCTLIYTSGTTGPPKAVMISQDNLTWTSCSLISSLPEAAYLPEAHSISYLPLSHIAAQLTDLYLPMILCAEKNSKATLTFARPDALKGSLSGTLQLARPTIFLGVPRVWEKFNEGISAKSKDTVGFKKVLVTRAKASGAAQFEQSQVGGNGRRSSTLYKTLVFDKIKVALGLDRCQMHISSAAPLSQHVINYFGQFNIPVIECYGMSECTGPQTLGTVNFFKVGSCGVPIAGVEMFIDHKSERGDKEGEGEICYRGRHIMMGYMKDAEKTQEAIDKDGWLHSGDIGRVDDKGLLFITGRIKEIIITAGGENIAPVPIEDNLKKFLPAISNCMMIGDKRKYNVVLIAPRVVVDPDTTEPSNNLDKIAAAIGTAKTLEEVSSDPAWIKYVTDGIKATNKESVSNASHIQYFRFVQDFSLFGGELTPTMKLKRSVVNDKYAELIEEMYGAQPDLAAALKNKESKATAATVAPVHLKVVNADTLQGDKPQDDDDEDRKDGKEAPTEDATTAEPTGVAAAAAVAAAAVATAAAATVAAHEAAQVAADATAEAHAAVEVMKAVKAEEDAARDEAPEQVVGDDVVAAAAAVEPEVAAETEAKEAEPEVEPKEAEPAVEEAKEEEVNTDDAEAAAAVAAAATTEEVPEAEEPEVVVLHVAEPPAAAAAAVVEAEAEPEASEPQQAVEENEPPCEEPLEEEPATVQAEKAEGVVEDA